MRKGRASLSGNLVALAVILAVTASFCWLIFSKLGGLEWKMLTDARGVFFTGWLRTVFASLVALVVATTAGIVLMFCQRSSLFAVRWFGVVLVEAVRNTPLLVFLLIGYYLVAPVFGIESGIFAGIILLGIFSGAYLGEIFRGGVESVGESQIEAARAVGFNPAQVYRHVVGPQAIRRVMPAVAGEFVNLVKNSSLLSVIGVSELTREVDIQISGNLAGYENYIALAVGYLIITVPISWLSRSLERRFAYEA